MPVSKSVRRAAREGGNVGSSPGGTVSTPSGLFILEVKSANLKENKQGPYRSVTGVAADGKLYWAPLDVSQKPKKGQMITLRGKSPGSFGGEDGKPEFHKILGPDYFAEVVSITDKSEAIQERVEEKPLKFGGEETEALQKTLEPLIKQYGIGSILTVLGELS